MSEKKDFLQFLYVMQQFQIQSVNFEHRYAKVVEEARNGGFLILVFAVKIDRYMKNYSY